MKKMFAACGAGLVLALVPGEVSQGPNIPERFAGYVSDKPDACPNGPRQPMPSILLKGEMLVQRGDRADETNEADLKMQERICKAAVRIGNSLLSAVNNYRTKSGFEIEIINEDHRASGRPAGIHAHPTTRKGWVDMDVTFITDRDAPITGPAVISSIDGIWEVDSNTYERVQIRKIHLAEGAQAWDLRANRYHYDDQPNQVLVDPTRSVSTRAEFEQRIAATDAALKTLDKIPIPALATE